MQDALNRVETKYRYTINKCIVLPYINTVETANGEDPKVRVCLFPLIFRALAYFRAFVFENFKSRTSPMFAFYEMYENFRRRGTTLRISGGLRSAKRSITSAKPNGWNLKIRFSYCIRGIWFWIRLKYALVVILIWFFFMILVDLPVNLKVFFIPLPDTWFMQQLLLNMSSIINLPMSISVLPMSDGLLDILTLFTVHFWTVLLLFW